MRRAIAAVLVTAIAVFVPATTVQAKPKPLDVHKPNADAIEVKTLWPICTIVLGIGICIPP
jgi:hypothetical protein